MSLSNTNSCCCMRMLADRALYDWLDVCVCVSVCVCVLVCVCVCERDRERERERERAIFMTWNVVPVGVCA